MAGVTDQGFVSKTYEEIIEGLETEQRARIGPNVNTSTEAIIGQLNGIFGALAREQWEVSEATYNASSILSASGVGLDRKVALTTTQRNPETFSTVSATLNLDAGITVAAGSEASVLGDSDAIFQAAMPITNPGGAPADIVGLFTATTAGPVRANTGTLTVIETPVAGWNSITNLADAFEGSEIESDSGLRTRYLRTASGKGRSPIDSIQAAVAAVPNVIDVVVFENTLDVITGGIDPHSVEAVVVASAFDDDAIAQAIWDSKGGGIGTSGARSGNATDSNGDNQPLNYGEAIQINAHVRMTIAVNQNWDPGAGPAGLREDIADWGDAVLTIGLDLIVLQLTRPIFDFGGVVDIILLEVSDDGIIWQTTNLIAQPRELIDLDTGRITITTQPFQDLP